MTFSFQHLLFEYNVANFCLISAFSKCVADELVSLLV